MRSERRSRHLYFSKIANLVEEDEISLAVRFCTAVAEKKLKMSHQIGDQGSHHGYPIALKTQTLVEDIEISVPIKVLLISAPRLQIQSWKCLSQSEAKAAVFVFWFALTNLVQDVDILLPVKFPSILFSGFRELKSVSTNQMPGRSCWCSDRTEKRVS